MLPASLDRLSYVAQRGPDRLVISDRDRWSEPLDGMIRRVLAADLEACLPGQVLTPGDPPQPGPARQIQVNIRRFSAGQDGKVTLAADWSLLAGTPPRVTARRSATIVLPARSARAQDAAGVMGQALASLGQRIVAGL